MIERLDRIENKYEELTKKLNNEEIIKDYKQAMSLSKEQKTYEETVFKYREFKKNKELIEETKKMLKDPELYEIANEDLQKLLIKNEKLIKELEVLLIPKDGNDDKNIIMEIRGAAGGDEANIFAGDLFRMYTNYFEKNNWKLEIINEEAGTSGGFSQIEFYVKGENVYSKMKYECGSHRVQRIPETETQGRVHTSTATVLVMPEVENVEVDIKEGDIKIDVYHSGGAGGQSVNTSDSAVRMTHLPTGIVVTCQTERSQLKNKDKALSILKNRIYDYEKQKQEIALGTERKNKIGTGDRSEKVRTYNYPQNRVTDHRINLTTMDLDKVMDGSLDTIINALIAEDQRLKLENE